METRTPPTSQPSFPTALDSTRDRLRSAAPAPARLPLPRLLLGAALVVSAAACGGSVGGSAGGNLNPGGNGGNGNGGNGNSTSPVAITSILLNTVDGDKFPTYLAHLFGQKVNGNPLHAAELTLGNSGSSAADVNVTAELQGYSHPLTSSARVPAGSKASGTIDLTFDFAALYGVSSAVSANFAFTLKDQKGDTLQSVSKTVTVLPRNTIFWSLPDAQGKPQDARRLVSVFVTPHDQAHRVDTLLTEAARHSRFGAMIGYQYRGAPIKESYDVPGGGCSARSSYYQAGEKVTVSVASAGAATAAYWVVDDANYALYQQGKSAKALGGSGTVGSWNGSLTVGQAGQYHHLACSPPGAARSFTVSRTIGDDEGAIDQLAAIFLALKQRGLVYTSVSQDFFANSQNVKYPSDSLATDSANCIDGTLVFASALESMGMEPQILFVPGHAFVGVRLAPGQDLFIPIETTMVSKAMPMDAITTAVNRWGQEQKAGTLERIDVAAQRKAGIAPAPL